VELELLIAIAIAVLIAVGITCVAMNAANRANRFAERWDTFCVVRKERQTWPSS
jgi:hypothetical protein